MHYEENTHKSTRAYIERQKQEEIANAHVRQVDSQGRAYGTGKRKCSIARVWIEPGEAALLRPLTETKTLGLLDVNCPVKGGGVSGQIGAIHLGMSMAVKLGTRSVPSSSKVCFYSFLTKESLVLSKVDHYSFYEMEGPLARRTQYYRRGHNMDSILRMILISLKQNRIPLALSYMAIDPYFGCPKSAKSYSTRIAYDQMGLTTNDLAPFSEYPLVLNSNLWRY
ncbi:ribosomal protein S9, Ribosomal protein S5 domain 2-type fold protein [Artemisia annua]|uniref:Ribosomal protein S9, Ribosomal protein S5 domain 2-type fold protein n=1 Tax=Artemisia annua TaxID=35608 RepID=A0A2U1L6L2_ARTAN|nr:ribosomal protein S9, Ribosomal protein S5 domain 2-type fold protein [Artemisia annua]